MRSLDPGLISAPLEGTLRNKLPEMDGPDEGFPK